MGLVAEGMSLTIDDVQYAIPAGQAGMSLAHFVRNELDKSTVKIGCNEGGCGACAVQVRREGEDSTPFTVNGCLVPLIALAGSSVYTSYGLAKQHPAISDLLASEHASQCGFCTPGMHVALHTAHSKTKAACMGPADAEAHMVQAMDGHLCRCTGYRPLIAAAIRSCKVGDIEDASCAGKGCGGAAAGCSAPHACHGADRAETTIKVADAASGATWHLPQSLAELVHLYDGSQALVAGHTSVGIPGVPAFSGDVVCISRVPELRGCEVTGAGALSLGAACSLQDVVDTLDGMRDGALRDCWEVKGYHLLVRHLNAIAGHAVRGAATVGGALALFKAHPYESDIATLFCALGATVVVSRGGSASELSVREFLSDDYVLPGAGIVTRVHLPLIPDGKMFYCRKFSARAMNAHATFNFAALFTTLPAGARQAEEAAAEDGWEVLDSCGLVTEVALAAGFYSSAAGERWVVDTLPNIEAAVKGKDARAAVAAALRVVPDALKHASAQWRSCYERDLSSCLLRSLGVAAGVAHATEQLPHHSEFRHDFRLDYPGADPSTAPVGAAVPKYSVVQQINGDARYTDDFPRARNCLFAALVLAPDALQNFVVDKTAALAVPGVVSVLCAADLPDSIRPFYQDVPVLATRDAQYVSEPVAVVLAHTQAAANTGVALVTITGSPFETHTTGQPSSTAQPGAGVRAASVAVTGRELQEQPPVAATARTCQEFEEAVAEAGADSVQVSGKWHMAPVKHMYMEPQTAVATPDEDGRMEVVCATQCPDQVQGCVSDCLQLPMNKVKIVTRRIGGGFGGKGNHSYQIGSLAAVAAHVSGQQVRLAVDRRADLKLAGGRPPISGDYTVLASPSGRILALKGHIEYVTGWYDLCGTEGFAFGCKEAVMGSYAVPKISISLSYKRMRVPSYSAMRGPAAIEAQLFTEHIVYHVAATLGMSPTALREMNLRSESKRAVGGPGAADADGAGAGASGKLSSAQQFTLPRMWRELRDSSAFAERQAAVDEHNRRAKWTKKGLSMVPVTYPMFGYRKPALVSIHGDGSVDLTVPGAEMGQGLHTKCIQVAAHELSAVFQGNAAAMHATQKHLLTATRIADSNSAALPHIGITGGSVTSEGACRATAAACRELVASLSPLLSHTDSSETTKAPSTWLQLIQAAIPGGYGMPVVRLTAVSGPPYPQDEAVPYVAYGAGVLEAEVDVLTGESRVCRADLLYDCGKSINPATDLGQVEGAFIIGQGQMLEEVATQDTDTGEISNASTWSYKIPCAADCPEVFRAKLLSRSANAPGAGWAGSKAVGEPPLLLSVGVLEAVKLAVAAAATKKGQRDDQKVLAGSSLSAIAELCPPAMPQVVQSLFDSVTPEDMLA